MAAATGGSSGASDTECLLIKFLCRDKKGDNSENFDTFNEAKVFFVLFSGMSCSGLALWGLAYGVSRNQSIGDEKSSTSSCHLYIWID